MKGGTYHEDGRRPLAPSAACSSCPATLDAACAVDVMAPPIPVHSDPRALPAALAIWSTCWSIACSMLPWLERYPVVPHRSSTCLALAQHVVTVKASQRVWIGILTCYVVAGDDVYRCSHTWTFYVKATRQQKRTPKPASSSLSEPSESSLSS